MDQRVLLLLFFFAFTGCKTQQSTGPVKPNILLIVVDDQGYADFSPFEEHSSEISTPNMQRLADEHGMNPIAAYLTIDWLIKDPEAALMPLTKGHDWVK